LQKLRLALHPRNYLAGVAVVVLADDLAPDFLALCLWVCVDLGLAVVEASAAKAAGAAARPRVSAETDRKAAMRERVVMNNSRINKATGP